ncbi:DUF6221 family protein [Micromonospora profundi]|uniref:DUF6221 family protein n=1 Tax=Micromonospora profundi TaxID=1420889 RepID=UPI003648B633
MTDSELSIFEFLRARYDELEQAANAAKTARRPWYFDHVDDAAKPFVDLALNPDSVLNDLASKRAILAQHRPAWRRMSWDEDAAICDTCRYDNGLDVYFFPCPTLRALAVPYAAHSDYQEAWKP